MENWEFVADTNAVAPGAMLSVRAGGVNVLLVNVEGTLYAMSDFCTHSKCFLHNGKLKGKVVTCPCHFAQFDVTTGAVLAPPAKTALTMYQVKTESDGIYVQVES
jgi:nitrite reductase/ring-hydroxylating ferredoxin subunit